MSDYTFPTPASVPVAPERTVFLVASGDLRDSANVAGWPVQEAVERQVTAAIEEAGWSVVRAHDVDPTSGHGFIRSQRQGIEVFRRIPPQSPVVVVEAVWQYSHHLLAGLRTHAGPILTVANFEGKWPGLVGLLGLNAGMAKMGTPYSSLWSRSFDDEWFLGGLSRWLDGERLVHDESHVTDWDPSTLARFAPELRLGDALAEAFVRDKAIIGVFDEGCMGMYNAIIDDELLNP
ncbi:MAG: fucose isomerase, partial [Phycicoccus sp.]